MVIIQVIIRLLTGSWIAKNLLLLLDSEMVLWLTLRQQVYFGLPFIIVLKMSEVIEDMEVFPPARAPYYVLASTCRLGIFSSSSHISYSESEIHILKRSELSSCFELTTKIVVEKQSLSLQSYLMKNGEYFVINSTEQRKNLYRSFLKTSFEPRMKIVINHQGRMSFKMHTFLASHLQFRQSKQVPKIYKLIEGVYTQVMETFEKAFQKIKLSIEPIYEKVIYDNSDRLERLDIIKNTCRFTYVQPSFMKRDGKRGKLNHENLPTHFISEPQLALTNMFEVKVQSDKIVDNMKYLLFIELWQQTYNLQKVEDTSLYKNFNLAKIKHIYQSNLNSHESKQPVQKIDPHQQIFSKIHILDLQKIQWCKIYEGGFGFLSKGNVTFHYQKQNDREKKYSHEKPIQRVMIMKTDKYNNFKNSRIDIEKLILGNLKGQKCRYLPKFYQTSQKLGKIPDFLLTQYYPLKSLDNWLNNFGQFSSLFTKITFLILILYGLNFLHENGIVHRDLKKANMLIDNKMVVKITDFGESFHKNLEPYLKSKGRDCKPGFTFPYTPPEIFLKKDKYFKEATYDMFSLGFIIFEVIFGKSLFEGSKQSELIKIYLKEAQNMSKKLEMPGRLRSIIKQRIHVVAEELAYFGPVQLLTPILNVVERCLDPKIDNRPHLGWVIGIIKEIYNSLLDFYSF